MNARPPVHGLLKSLCRSIWCLPLKHLETGEAMARQRRLPSIVTSDWGSINGRQPRERAALNLQMHPTPSIPAPVVGERKKFSRGKPARSISRIISGL